MPPSSIQKGWRQSTFGEAAGLPTAAAEGAGLARRATVARFGVFFGNGACAAFAGWVSASVTRKRACSEGAEAASTDPGGVVGAREPRPRNDPAGMIGKALDAPEPSPFGASSV